MARQAEDKTSLGIFRPKEVLDVIVKPDAPDWKPGFRSALLQQRLWENRKASKEPPRKLPFKFQYKFTCDDHHCNGHQMMIEDWELGALYWRCIDAGATEIDACASVRNKFLNQMCGSSKDTHLFVGTVLAHPRSWVGLDKGVCGNGEAVTPRRQCAEVNQRGGQQTLPLAPGGLELQGHWKETTFEPQNEWLFEPRGFRAVWGADSPRSFSRARSRSILSSRRLEGERRSILLASVASFPIHNGAVNRRNDLRFAT